MGRRDATHILELLVKDFPRRWAQIIER